MIPFFIGISSLVACLDVSRAREFRSQTRHCHFESSENQFSRSSYSFLSHRVVRGDAKLPYARLPELGLSFLDREIERVGHKRLSLHLVVLNRESSALREVPSDTAATHLAQILILTTNSTESEKRLQQLQAAFSPDLNYVSRVVLGIDYHDFKTEAEEESQMHLPMTPLQRMEWAQVGNGLVHKGVAPEKYRSNGKLAVRLGFHRMEHEATKSPPGTWSLLLEDDARPVPGLNFARMNSFLGVIPSGVDEVFLEDRHCKNAPQGVIRGKTLDLYAFGATAFAITAVGAHALLKVPFTHFNDHSLNVPVRDGTIAAFCPNAPLFLHEYPHSSTNSEIGRAT